MFLTRRARGRLMLKSFLVDERTSCWITASSPDVTLGAPILVLQQVRSGGAVTPDHVTDDEEERDQAQTNKLQYFLLNFQNEHHHLTSEMKSAMSLESVTTSSLAPNTWAPELL